MLLAFDKIFDNLPSAIINVLTGGTKGASLCGRLYLYQTYVSQANLLVNSLRYVIDILEFEHCRTAARHWIIRHKKHGYYLPDEYKNLLKV